MIAWRDDYNIGVEEVDHQHRDLVHKLNEFMDACIHEKGKEKIMETLSFLKDYTVEHFRSEEEIMKKYGYPDYTDHKKHHDAFITAVLNLENSIRNEGVTVLSTLKLNRTLTDWLMTHICKCDAKIGEYLHSKQLI